MRSFREELRELLQPIDSNGSNGLSEAAEVLDLEVSRRGIARYHALLQFIVALDLYMRGFDVSVEKTVDGGFKADVYAESPQGRIVVEIETGYVPLDRIRFLEEFLEAKIAFKAIAYSLSADLFLVATPSHIRLPLVPELIKPLENRDVVDVIVIRELALKYEGAKASRMLWRAPLSRIDGVAYINISNLEVQYKLLGSSLNWDLAVQLTNRNEPSPISSEHLGTRKAS